MHCAHAEALELVIVVAKNNDCPPWKTSCDGGTVIGRFSGRHRPPLLLLLLSFLFSLLASLLTIFAR